MAALSTTQINQLYVSYFGRPADFAGLNFYQTVNATPDQVAIAFASSRESIALFGSLPTSAQINAIYQNLFNRDAEPDGLAYWSKQVSDGKLSLAAMALAVGNGAQGTDRTIIQNKVAFANAFVGALDTYEERQGYTGDDAAASARSFIQSIGASLPADGVAGRTNAAVADAVAVGGRTIVLTPGRDSLVGTSGNDTFLASAGVADAGNSIDGGTGQDTLVYDFAAAGYALPRLSNVERIQFNSPRTAEFDVFALDRIHVTVKDPLPGTAVVSQGPVGFGRTEAGAAFVSALGVYGSPGIFVAIEDGMAIGRLTVGSPILKLVRIDSSGAPNAISTLDTTAQIGSSLSFSGNAKLTVGEINRSYAFSAIDASATTGGVDLNLGDYAGSVAGGSGDDRFSFNASISSIKGGAGQDTVAVLGRDLTNADRAASDLLTALNAMTGVETLEFTGAASARIADSLLPPATYLPYALFNAGLTKIVFNTADARGVDFVDAANANRTYAFGGLNEGSATLNLAPGTTVVNLSLEGSAPGAATGGSATVATLAIALQAVEPSATAAINIASTGIPEAGANSISTIAVRAGSTIKIAGSTDLTVGALAERATIDASTFAGKLSIAGSQGADTFILGSGRDTVTVDAAGSNPAHLDTIANFTSADTLILAGTTVAATADLVRRDVSAAATLEQALIEAETATPANAVSYFSYAGDTYILANTGASSVLSTDSADAVIRLAGVQALTADSAGIHGTILG